VAARRGLEGTFADVLTGEQISVRERLRVLLEELEPYAESLGAERQFARAHAMVDANGAQRMRAAAADDPHRATQWLAHRFLEGC
jgi:gamma-glutamyl:cysteine ligase YbdK (ATP-grasp superfamily)